MKKLVVNLLKISVTVVILFLIFKKFQIGWDSIVDALRTSSPIWWVASLFTQAMAIIFSILRWRVLLQSQNLKVPGGHLVNTYLVGRFLGTFTPTGVGLEAYKAYDIARFTKKATESVAVVVVEKFLTILALSLMVILSLFTISMPPIFLAAFFGLFGFLLLITVILVVKASLLELILKFPLPAKGKIEGIIRTAVEAFNRYRRNKGALLAAIFFGVLVYTSLFATFYTNGKALRLPSAASGSLYEIQTDEETRSLLQEMSIEWKQLESGSLEVFLTPEEETTLRGEEHQMVLSPAAADFNRKGLSFLDVMRVGPLTQMGSMIPLSIAGIGLREGAFSELLEASRVWVGTRTILAATMWYFVSISLNIVGAIIFLTRRTDYQASREEIDRVLKGK